MKIDVWNSKTCKVEEKETDFGDNIKECSCS